MRWNQKHSKSKMFSLVEEYLLGEVTQSVLCDREGINRGTFKYWCRKYQTEQIESLENSEKPIVHSVNSDFLSVSVSDIEETTSAHTLELIYPNGVRLQLNTILDTQGLLIIKQLLLCLD